MATRKPPTPPKPPPAPPKRPKPRKPSSRKASPRAPDPIEQAAGYTPPKRKRGQRWTALEILADLRQLEAAGLPSPFPPRPHRLEVDPKPHRDIQPVGDYSGSTRPVGHLTGNLYHQLIDTGAMLPHHAKDYADASKSEKDYARRLLHKMHRIGLSPSFRTGLFPGLQVNRFKSQGKAKKMAEAAGRISQGKKVIAPLITRFDVITYDTFSIKETTFGKGDEGDPFYGIIYETLILPPDIDLEEKFRQVKARDAKARALHPGYETYYAIRLGGRRAFGESLSLESLVKYFNNWIPNEQNNNMSYAAKIELKKLLMGYMQITHVYEPDLVMDSGRVMRARKAAFIKDFESKQKPKRKRSKSRR